tara:strand:- start:2029 stop:2271 length:243 start_codon:yes stop_codon:yes gene_type:complete
LVSSIVISGGESYDLVLGGSGVLVGAATGATVGTAVGCGAGTAAAAAVALESVSDSELLLQAKPAIKKIANAVDMIILVF